jgi:carbon-monoxide dehydrogenase large subunit
MPGVIAIWTAEDLPEVVAGLNEPGPVGIEQRARPILNRDEVNYAGEAYAMDVAETAYEAQDAVEQVLPELEPIPAVGGVMTAAANGAATVHPDMKSNVAQSAAIAYGDIGAAFASDSVTAKIRLTTARVAGAAMEPRAVAAAPDAETGGIKMWTSTQSIFPVRAAVASALAIDESKVRVLAEDVGGGFGAKASVFPEEVLTALAAWRLQRPARWVATRSEDSATTAQGHGSVIELELAADSSGKLRGLRGRLIHDVGAYAGSGTGQPSIIVAHMISAYVLPAMHIEHQLVYTNSVPSGFIRGGGRPLGNYAVERVMDRLARQLNLAPAELRRRNLIQPDQIPYTTGYPAGRRGYVYDSGDYPRLLAAVLEKLGPDPVGHGDADGRLVGLGVACCVESTGFGRGEPAKLHVAKDGSAHVYVGSTPQPCNPRGAAARRLRARAGVRHV